jgi:choline kinase
LVTDSGPFSFSMHTESAWLRRAPPCFFVSSPSTSSRTLLLRVYSPSSGVLIPRLRELQVLRVLSSRPKLGPRIYGTSTNGRIAEEYFDSVMLTAINIHGPQIKHTLERRWRSFTALVLRSFKGSPTPAEVVLELGVQKKRPPQ